MEMKNFIIWTGRYLIQSRRHFIRMKERRTTWQMIPRKRKNCLKHPITMEKKLSLCLQIIMMNMKKSVRLLNREYKKWVIMSSWIHMNGQLILSDGMNRKTGIWLLLVGRQGFHLLNYVCYPKILIVVVGMKVIVGKNY